MMTLLEFVVFVLFMAVFRVVPGFSALAFPLVFFFLFLIVLGLSLGLSALNVFFRDVQFIWRLVVQIGFFATPVIYPITIFPQSLQRFVMLNPMARILTISRDCILYGTAPGALDMAYVAASSLVVLFIGYLIFDRLEPRFARRSDGNRGRWPLEDIPDTPREEDDPL